MNRRGFMGSILAAGMAPAVVGSGILMPLGKVWRPSVLEFGTDMFPPATMADFAEMQKAMRNLLAYGMGGLHVAADGRIRALGREIYQPGTGREIAIKMKYAVTSLNEHFGKGE